MTLIGRSRRPASRDTSASLRVGLLRHGEVKGGVCFRGSTDDPLTDIGLDQMRAATNRDSGGDQNWDRVISSPLQRCAVFAREFAQRHSLPLVFDERFQEMHFGTWEGRTAAELMAEDPAALTRFWADPGRHPPLASEPLSRFQVRVLTAWDSIVRSDSGQKILLVTHGGVIRVLLCHVQQRPAGKLLEMEIKHGALYTLRVSVDVKQTPTAHLIAQV